MSRKIAERNTLVKMDLDPDAPEIQGPGIEITLGRKGRPQFAVGEPVILHGTIQADLKLLAQIPGDLASGVFLTLIRTDRPYGRTVQLIVPTAQIPKPPPQLDEESDYLESGNFQVDLVKFFELPDEPGNYTIQAALGPYCSRKVAFEIIPSRPR